MEKKGAREGDGVARRAPRLGLLLLPHKAEQDAVVHALARPPVRRAASAVGPVGHVGAAVGSREGAAVAGVG